MQVLVVEDDRNLRRFLSKALREEGFGAVEAESGDRALDRALAASYSCIILDVMLPGRDGFDVVTELRSRRVFTPVLMLTAKDELESRVRGLEAGADDYLTKPFDLAELVVRVKSLLRRIPVERTDVILISNLELNRLTHQVRRGGHKIELTSKEYALLEYLLSSPSRVFTRSMILEHVWDQSFEGVTNIVDVYVRHLRRKVDDPFPVKLIHTVRGVGYCVRETQQSTGSQVQ
jgi:DNA-binding response OmpR family regulator